MVTNLTLDEMRVALTILERRLGLLDISRANATRNVPAVAVTFARDWARLDRRARRIRYQIRVAERGNHVDELAESGRVAATTLADG